MTATRFRKKPVEIEAMRWDGSYECQRRIVTWSDGAIAGWADDHYHLTVSTLEGEMRANPGDWIIRGVKGEFYPCRGDIFEATYLEAVDPDVLEVFRGGDRLWYWHRQDPGNHELGCQGEGYDDKDGAIVGALRWNPDLTEEQITVLA